MFAQQTLKAGSVRPQKDSIAVTHKRKLIGSGVIAQASEQQDSQLLHNDDPMSRSNRSSKALPESHQQIRASLNSPNGMIKAVMTEGDEETKEESSQNSRKLQDKDDAGDGGVPCGGMHRHDKERIDRLGKQIKSKRERQPNGQKKRLPHKVTFCDQL